MSQSDKPSVDPGSDTACLQAVVKVSGFLDRARPDEDIIAYVARLAALAGPLEQPQEPKSDQANLAQASGGEDLQTALHEGTPRAQWAVTSEPDPHAGKYDGERAALCLGYLTDDELANGAFMNYDRPLSLPDMLKPKPGQHMPIVWMTAVKERIRWLSRALAACEAPAGSARSDKPAASSESSVSVPKEQQ